MYYISTRGAAPKAPFSDILLEGLAPDGGLYVPESWPTVSLETLTTWKSLPYAELAAQLLSLFAPEISIEEWRKLTTRTYTASLYGHTRPDSDAQKIFPVRKLEDSLYLQELSNGPTLAFKDAAMQLLGNMLSWALAKQNRTLTILGATSGDTGSAAIHALRGKTGLKVVMLSPAGRMSDFQRAQMYSVMDDNILNVAVQGTFDDCQDLVKTLNADAVFKNKHHLGAVNSINWARVIAQTVYYISAYLQTAEQIGDPVSFCVPSGNFGNAYAGLVAQKMGVPIARIIVATNENDVLHRALQTGVYAPQATAMATSSPSMDITKASNFERAIFDAAGQNGALVKRMWDDLATKGRIDFKQEYPAVWEKLQKMGLASGSSTHTDRLNSIREAKGKWGLFIDPHTADGLHTAQQLRETNETVIVLETAQAAKFAPTIQEALGVAPPVPAAFEDLHTLPQKVRTIENDAHALKELIEAWNA